MRREVDGKRLLAQWHLARVDGRVTKGCRGNRAMHDHIVDVDDDHPLRRLDERQKAVELLPPGLPYVQHRTVEVAGGVGPRVSGNVRHLCELQDHAEAAGARSRLEHVDRDQV